LHYRVVDFAGLPSVFIPQRGSEGGHECSRRHGVPLFQPDRNRTGPGSGTDLSPVRVFSGASKNPLTLLQLWTKIGRIPLAVG